MPLLARVYTKCLSPRVPSSTTVRTCLHSAFSSMSRTDARRLLGLLQPDVPPSGDPVRRLLTTWTSALLEFCVGQDYTQSRLCTLNHPLVPYATWVGADGVRCRCDECLIHADVGTLFWGCRACDYDLCNTCATSTSTPRLLAAPSPRRLTSCSTWSRA